MSKAERIRELAKQGMDDGRIASIVAREFGSCCRAYVRTCARQRIDGRQSKGDIRYAARHPHRFQHPDKPRTLRGRDRLKWLSERF